MNEEYKSNAANEETRFSRQVGAQAARKLKASVEGPRGASGSAWACRGWSAGP